MKTIETATSHHRAATFAASGLACLGLAALPACDQPEDGADAPTVMRNGNGNGNGNGVKRVELCHDGETLTVPEPAIASHLGHGDQLGACPSGCNAGGSCDDGNLCTSDGCQPDGTCAHVAVSCSDGNPCTIDACDPSVGCVAAPADGILCDDGNECTDDDACASGACVGAAIAGCCADASDCTDDDPCTVDACTDQRCANAPLDCSDDDACTAGFCDPQTGECDSVAVSCDDGDPCTADACDSDSGCVHVPTPDAQACLGTITRIPGTAVNAWQFPTTVADAYVAWVGYAGRQDIMLHEFATGQTVNVTESPLDVELRPEVDGQRLVWDSNVPALDGEIELLDLVTGERRVLTEDEPAPCERPSIRGDIVAYLCWTGSGTRLAIRDLRRQASEFVGSVGVWQPRVGDSVVAYELAGGEIGVYDLATATETRLPHTPGTRQVAPAVDGRVIVYLEDGQVYAHDLVNSTTRALTGVVSGKTDLRISGHRVVWIDGRLGGYDLFMYDLRADREIPLVTDTYVFGVDIHGDRITYMAMDEPYLFTLRPRE